MIAVMGLTGIVVSFWLWDKINFIGKLYRTLRADIFSCMGLNGNKENLGQKINLKINIVFYNLAKVGL
jgi:hypothetical protein